MNIDEYSEDEENYALAQQQEELKELPNNSLAEIGEYIEPVSQEEEEEFSKREVSDYGTDLPAIVEEFVKAAVQVSNGNHIPASISFFTILGQIVKDFIIIPYEEGREDTRIHFCWVQTSGTGKSTLWNFVGPIADRTFDKINKNPMSKRHPPLIIESEEPLVPDTMTRTFDIFGLTDYTDAVLIGGYSDHNTAEENERPIMEDKRNPGQLEGNGLAHWDEFEYSGIFNQTQHQNKSIVYLNTLMNSLAGETWIISKALMGWGNKKMECFCERSIIAMTYPPENLTEVIATKGVMQRMLLYVKNVSKEAQHQMRLEQINKAGKIKEVEAPIDKYANAIFKLYTLTQEKFNEVGGDPLKTMTYTPNFNRALLLAYGNMQHDLLGTRLEVDSLADNFTTRMTKTLTRMAVLCCVAESASIRDKSQRFIVTGKHVQQAERIIRQCYRSLVGWLDQSLRSKRPSVTDKSYPQEFKEVFTSMSKNEDGSIHKAVFLAEVMKRTKKKKTVIYRIFSELKPLKLFEEEKMGRSVFIKLRAGDEE